MCVGKTQMNRIQRKHEILRLLEDGARGFGLGHANADFVHLIQQADSFFFIVADGNTKQIKISGFLFNK